jgi:hypothetical protein
MAAELLGPNPRGRDDRNALAMPPMAMAVWSHRTVDLTPDGIQPFTTTGHRTTVALDGHVGNAASLRRELEDTGKRLRGHGDAELIAEGANHWGLNRLLQKLEGAFSFALWDDQTKTLHLVRDRLGTRPLYVTRTDEAIAFTSDMRAFKNLPGFTPVIDTHACASYLAWGHPVAPHALWNDVMALPHAHRMMITAGDKTLPTPEGYWSPATALEESILRGRGDAAKHDRLTATLANESVRLDVPFTMLDDFSAVATQLRGMLDRACGKSFKSWPLTMPDGAALQTAFDALAAMAEPVSDSMAPAWYTACKNATAESSVCIAPSGLVIPAREDPQNIKMRKLLAFVPPFLRRFVPKKFAGLVRESSHAYEDYIRLWDIEAPQAQIIEPRIDLSLEGRIRFFEFSDRFCNGTMPALDRIAHIAGIELRLPLADSRMLDIGLPTLTATATPDIATWLRGPLRPRVQDLITRPLLARIGLVEPAPYTAAWRDFLAGDNTRVKPLWALATLLAWARNN